MNLDVNNFENWTADEYRDNLLRLGAVSHNSLVGKTVYYSQTVYGEHTVVKWDADKAEFLLDLDGYKFWSNPFMIQIIKTIEQIQKEVAKECAEEHFEVILNAEIMAGDYEQARRLLITVANRYIDQFIFNNIQI